MLWPKGQEVNSRELFLRVSQRWRRGGRWGLISRLMELPVEESWVNHMQGFSLMFENEEMGIPEQLG